MSSSVPTPVATATYRVKFRGESPRDQTCPPEKPSARVPRVARLLALAHRIDGMIRLGELRDWAEAARLIGVTRARMTQIANLLLLAPGIQEALLDSRQVRGGPNLLSERELRKILKVANWAAQRKLSVNFLSVPLPLVVGRCG